MSLFKVQDLWSVQCGDTESIPSLGEKTKSYNNTDHNNNFHAHSLTVGTLGEFEPELMIVSNWTGILKIFCLARDNTSEADVARDNPNGYVSDDCLVELCMTQAVLQTCIGKYVSGSQITYLAVLHPSTIAIFNLHVIPGTTKHGNEAQLQHIQDYRLGGSSPFRFFSGPFGLNQYHECFAIVYLDDSVELLDQSESARVRLNDVVLPCAMVYIASSDSLLIHTDNAMLVSYRYQNLLSQKKDKRAAVTWSLNLGLVELVGLAVVALSLSSVVVCVGAAGLSVVHENGFLVVAKRLQYAARCFHAYNHPSPQDPDNFMILVASDTQTILLYDKHLTLVWSASLLRVPVSIHLYNTPTLPGLICTLSEEGHLDLNYLGTSPLLFIPPPLPKSSHTKSIPQLQARVKQLQTQIAEVQSCGSGIGGDGERADSNPHTLDCRAAVERGMIRVQLEVKGVTPPPYVQVCLEPASPYITLDQSLFISQSTLDSPTTLSNFQTKYSINADKITGTVISNSTEYTAEPNNSSIRNVVIDPSIRMVIVYNSISAPQSYRVIEEDIYLPLSDTVTPISVNEDEVMNYLEFKGDRVFESLAEYYSDFFNQSPESEIESSDTTLGFQFIHSPARVSLSTHNTRLKISFSHLTHVNIILADFARKYGGKLTLDSSGVRVITQALYRAIAQCDKNESDLEKIKEHLAVLSGQYRVIERHLLCKIKEKTVSSVVSIERLLQDTFTRIMTQIELYAHAQHAVTSSTQETKQLATLWGKVVRKCAREDVSGLIQACLESVCQNYSQQSWSEVCSQQLDYILKEKLGIPVSRHKSTLTQTLQQLVDHMGSPETKGKPVSPIPEDDQEEKEEDINSQ